MEEKTVICTTCPKGCHVRAVKGENGVEVLGGNGCKRGIEFAINELTRPVRTLTTTVKIISENGNLLPVRSDKPIPKELLSKGVKALSGITVKAPILAGDIISADFLGTGTNIIACDDVER